MVGHKDESKHNHLRTAYRLDGHEVHAYFEIFIIPKPEFLLQMIRCDKPNLFHIYHTFFSIARRARDGFTTKIRIGLEDAKGYSKKSELRRHFAAVGHFHAHLLQ
jgi:hypothetical protein